MRRSRIPFHEPRGHARHGDDAATAKVLVFGSESICENRDVEVQIVSKNCRANAISPFFYSGLLYIPNLYIYFKVTEPQADHLYVYFKVTEPQADHPVAV